MLLAYRTLHCCFLGEEHMSLIDCLWSWIDMGEKHLSRLVLRDFLLVPRKEGVPWYWHTVATLAQMPCGVETTVSFYVLFSLSTFSIDLTPLNPETCWNLTPKNWLPVCQAIWTLHCHHWDGVPQKSSGSFFRLWIFRLILLPFSFPESQGRLVKSC